MKLTKILTNLFIILINAICIYIFSIFSNIIIGIFLSTILSITFLFFYAKISFLDLLLYYTFNYFICINSYILLQNINIYILYSILFSISVMTNFTIYFLLSKNNNLFIENLRNVDKFVNCTCTLLLSILSIFLIIFHKQFSTIIIHNFLYIFDAIFIFALLIIFHTVKLHSEKIKIENLELSIKSISNLYDETRAFKHDFQNIIQAIGGYVWTNDLEGLKKYYKQVFNDCNSSNNLAKLSPELINNPAIYNIIANKYFIAENNNITLNFDIMLDLKTLNMKTYEFARILGILLDNAIEATKECSQKSINMCFRKEKNKQIFSIENTYENKEVSIEKIFDKNFTTKPNNTGLGLWEVKKILSRNKNVLLFTTKNETFFSQKLEIYC